MNNNNLNTIYLMENGFETTRDRYTFKKGNFQVQFTHKGCILVQNEDEQVCKFDGYISDFKDVWLKYTGELL